MKRGEALEDFGSQSGGPRRCRWGHCNGRVTSQNVRTSTYFFSFRSSLFCTHPAQKPTFVFFVFALRRKRFIQRWQGVSPPSA